MMRVTCQILITNKQDFMYWYPVPGSLLSTICRRVHLSACYLGFIIVCLVVQDSLCANTLESLANKQVYIK